MRFNRRVVANFVSTRPELSFLLFPSRIRVSKSPNTRQSWSRKVFTAASASSSGSRFDSRVGGWRVWSSRLTPARTHRSETAIYSPRKPPYMLCIGNTYRGAEQKGIEGGGLCESSPLLRGVWVFFCPQRSTPLDYLNLRVVLYVEINHGNFFRSLHQLGKLGIFLFRSPRGCLFAIDSPGLRSTVHSACLFSNFFPVVMAKPPNDVCVLTNFGGRLLLLGLALRKRERRRETFGSSDHHHLPCL